MMQGFSYECVLQWYKGSNKSPTIMTGDAQAVFWMPWQALGIGTATWI
jgi:hypothetical protein